MILTRRQPFGISRYHAREIPEASQNPIAQGLVVRVRVTFESWFNERYLEADVFIDPGADTTTFSSRWIQAQGGTRRRTRPRVSVDLENADQYMLEESVSIELGGVSLLVGPNVRILPPSVMPGYEDMLVGRDFLSAHRLLLVLDGQENTFSLLLPSDEDNRRRREQIHRALDE